MSIADEIQRIKNNVANAYSVCDEKGATIPQTQNIANLANTINSISSSAKYGITVDNFLGDVDSNGELKLPVSGTLNAVGIKKVDDYALSCKFGGNAWGTSRSQGLAHIIFPDLTYIGNAGFGYFYTYSTDLETVSFPELVQIGQCGMQSAFQHNSKLRSALFPKLKICSGMYSSLSGTFSNCPKLEEVNFDSLETLTSSALSSAFSSCSKLKTLSFPSLTTESFGDYTDQFNSMLSGVTGCTVHFPFRIKDTISSWSSVIAGFGGTNTVILFDLHCAILNFITNKITCDYSINGRHLSESNGYAEPGSTKYACYDSSTNKLIVETLNNLEADVSYNIDIDTKLNNTFKKITVSTGVSGLDVYFKVNGLNAKAVEESTGKYVINLLSNGDEITYFIDGGNSYKDIESSFTSDGTNKTFTHSLSSANWVSFTRPNLTANGTMGGNSFAVSDKGMLNTSYAGYKAFDSSTSTYTWTSNTSSELTFYNPKPLKVSRLVVTYSQDSTTYQAKSIAVKGSNDNENWVDLTEIGYESGISRTINVNSSKGYKYHKLIFEVKSIYIRVTDIAITAQYKE